MSNQQILRALNAFGPILHAEIKQPRTSKPGKNQGGVANWRRYDNSLQNALFMKPVEVAEWNNHYGIEKLVSEKANGGFLYVDGGISPKGHGFRLNLEETVYDHRILQIDSSKIKFYLMAHAYVGYHRPGQAYNAFIGLDLHAKQNGKWVLEQIPGTGNASWNSPVFSPMYIARASIWFNTSIKPELSNSVVADENRRPYDSMHHGQIHVLETIDQIQVPNDPRLNFFFWQINRLMRPFAWLSLRRALM